MCELSKNEIRIGNYLISKMMGILQVQMIPIDIDMDNYEPILLTEKWLVDFGFKDVHGNAWFSNGLFEIKKLNNGFHLRLIESLTSKYLQHIEHVHQLQNLYFALTGKELTHQKIN